MQRLCILKLDAGVSIFIYIGLHIICYWKAPPVLKRKGKENVVDKIEKINNFNSSVNVNIGIQIHTSTIDGMKLWMGSQT